MKQFITDVLTDFQKGRITLEEAADRLLAEKEEGQRRKTRSNQRLDSLCKDLQSDKDPEKIRELKGRLSHEFYNGDQSD